MFDAWLLADLDYGDGGKGTTVDWLASECEAHTVVLFTGGAQSARHVVTPDGRTHRFQQFGAASFLPGVATHVSRFRVCSPAGMLLEEERLREVGIVDAFDRTTVSAACLVITPFHESANRLREIARGAARHGSCGLGVGETVKDSLELLPESVIRVGDLRDRSWLVGKLERLREHKINQLRREGVIDNVRHLREAVEPIDVLWSSTTIEWFLQAMEEFTQRARIVPDAYLGEILARPGAVVFEPAHGVLIDEWRGFHPHTTWSTTTDHNANTLLREHGYEGRVRRLGIVRGYMVRHGAGPFPTQDTAMGERIPDAHNATDPWQGRVRVGHFDAVATRYAIACLEQPLDGLVVTCLDRLAEVGEWKMATSYEDMGRDIPLGEYRDLAYQEALTARLMSARPVYESSGSEEEHLARIQREVGVPIVATSHGPTRADKKWRSALDLHPHF